MFTPLKLVIEALRFAGNALRGNLLRTALSLLGVTIGVFSIISVLTVVDSLDRSIKHSLSFLGDRVIYVQKWPWQFGGEYKWWDYIKRPQPNFKEFLHLKKYGQQSSAITIFDTKAGLTAKYKNNSMSKLSVSGVSQAYNQVFDLPIARGRYFSTGESVRGERLVLIGHTVAHTLFGARDPLGETIKIGGSRFLVLGILQKQGESLLTVPDNDERCLIPYASMLGLFASKNRSLSPSICLKGKENDADLLELQAETAGLLRSYRRLKPRQENNFALNKSEALTMLMKSLMKTLTFAGWCIGSFAVLVGAFGIANIMFVSVKERTALIGIQKSLGAKNYFILLQFLFESGFLSIIGGAIGIALVVVLSFFSTESFVIRLTLQNVLIGLCVSSLVGILAGIFPAITAARLDPVTAIRSN